MELCNICFFVYIYVTWQLAFILGLVSADENETEIRQKVLKDYDRSITPILYARSEHKSYIAMNVFRIQGLDEVKGEFILEGVTHVAWSDDRLIWENGSVKFIRVSSDEIWIPHLKVLNRVSENEMTLDPLPIVFNGGVWWAPRWVFRTACIPNMKYFPFDRHTCEIRIVSVSEEGDLLQMNYSTTDLKHKAYVLTNFLIENNLWKLLSAKSESKRMVVDVDIVSDVGVFILVIERSMPLIALAVLTPSLVSVIILLTTFWMEAGCLIRAGINFTSILVSAGNLFTISRILPVTGAVTPAIVEYVSSVLILCMLSSFQAIAMSFLTRCKKQPPISYTTISEKFPNWALMMLALVPRSEETAIVDETFLFSDLTGRDQRSNLQTEDRKEENDTKIIKLHYPWEKHILLWERLLFYLFIIVILLLIVSVIITE
ncbi:acetylcholine receptor subunit beta-like isoform X1 [Argiope bruennichi]|uniref:acetylcholine receptor subunit beta-like isoform X1 n=1 Tax=Argiope bruennichi TaxID=94029 RepID=UPI00249442C1|nr:acetylcholine receptor subunit beta-like isoform X1 [Argiope bruennichi]